MGCDCCFQLLSNSRAQQGPVFKEHDHEIGNVDCPYIRAAVPNSVTNKHGRRTSKDNGVQFIIDSPTKTSKVGKPHVTVELTAYPNDPLLCAMSLLKIYLEKTKPFRGTERRLFLSYVPPYKAVGAETISRWIKSTLQVAGVTQRDILPTVLVLQHIALHQGTECLKMLSRGDK